MKRFFWVLPLWCSLSVSAVQALPPYALLFKAKYDYKPNCTMCHDRDTWDNTEFGKLFRKYGRNLEAFSKIEPLDPDRDGFSSWEEIKAKANPGDARSTPDRLGQWLRKLILIQPPKRHLLALFPQSVRYRFTDGTLTEEGRQKVEKRLHQKLRDEDLYPAYFIALSEQKTLGYALYSSTPGLEPCFFLTGYAPSATGAWVVTGLRPLKCDQRRLKKSYYLKQFVGKKMEQLNSVKAPRPSLARQSREIIKMVQRGDAILEELLE